MLWEYLDFGHHRKLKLLKYPEIKNKIHGCGPGKTYDHILKNISNPDKVSKYLSIEDWESNFDS